MQTTKSQWTKWLSSPGNIRVVSIEATHLMSELIAQQGLQGLAQVGYGEAVVASLLIASSHKSMESINMNAQGSGVFKQAMIDATPDGRVRGFLIEETNPEMHTYGAQGLNGPWGTGVLSVLYTQNFEGKYPYKGMVPISTGHFDEAVNDYFRDSEQTLGKVGLAVGFDKDRKFKARGILVQALGGATAEELDAVRALKVEDLRDAAFLADDEVQLKAGISALLAGRNFEIVEQRDLNKFCTCSQERTERALLLTGEHDVMEALGNDDFMTVTCDFCRTDYKITRERLKSIFSRDPSRLQ
jgi:molecular chaperone Hsp33